jgi:hypothetical protein
VSIGGAVKDILFPNEKDFYALLGNITLKSQVDQNFDCDCACACACACSACEKQLEILNNIKFHFRDYSKLGIVVNKINK